MIGKPCLIHMFYTHAHAYIHAYLCIYTHICIYVHRYVHIYIVRYKWIIIDCVKMCNAE